MYKLSKEGLYLSACGFCMADLSFPSQTIPRQPIPHHFPFHLAIKRHWVVRCNFAVIRTVGTVIDMTATIADDGITIGFRIRYELRLG